MRPDAPPADRRRSSLRPRRTRSVRASRRLLPRHRPGGPLTAAPGRAPPAPEHPTGPAQQRVPDLGLQAAQRSRDARLAHALELAHLRHRHAVGDLLKSAEELVSTPMAPEHGSDERQTWDVWIEHAETVTSGRRRVTGSLGHAEPGHPRCGRSRHRSHRHLVRLPRARRLQPPLTSAAGPRSRPAGGAAGLGVGSSRRQGSAERALRVRQIRRPSNLIRLAPA